MGLLDFAHQDYTPSWYADSAPRLAPQLVVVDNRPQQ